MSATRSIEWARNKSGWLVTKGGVYVEGRWALVRTRADLLPFMPQDDPNNPRQRAWAALTPAEEAEGGWDAVRFSWPKAMPPGLVPGVGRIVDTPAGKAWEGAGIRYYLADRGRPPRKKGATEEPPGCEIVDEAALLAHADALGRDLELVERGTGRPVKVRRANDRKVTKG